MSVISCEGGVKVDNTMEENTSEVIIPPEVWLEIFKLIPEPRNLSKLRPVCKVWQAIIDENFNMKVKINDDKMDVNSIFHFNRVTHCIVSKFVRESQPIQIFRDPTFLSSLTIRGPISRPNFLAIANQCGNVKELVLNAIVLVGNAQLFEAESTEETNVLSKFMGGLQTLVVHGLHIGSTEEEPTTINIKSLLNWKLSELKSLLVRLRYPDSSEDARFFHLLETCRSLESITICLRSFSNPFTCTPFVLPNLKCLSIEVKITQRLRDWLPFIGAQRTIRDLKIVVYGEYHGDGVETFELDWSVTRAILRNKQSLERLEMRTFGKTSGGIDVHFLGELKNLKYLSLYGYMQPKVHNLHLLREKMDTLVLENFKVKREEFELVADRIVNLKTRNISFI